jgi:hypothetical protein
VSRLSLAPLALALAAISILLNCYLLFQLAHPERLVEPIVADLTRDLVDEQGVISYDLRIPQGTPLALDLPIDERFSVAVDTVIPLNTTVRVPIRGPLGVARVAVPIRADIPLRTRLPLHIRHTFRLRTETTQPITIPIRLRVEDLLR